MISGIESTYTPNLNGISDQMEAVRNRQTQALERIGAGQPTQAITDTAPTIPGENGNRVTFGKLIGDLVNDVEATQKNSATELRRVMTGEVDNLHQSMIAMQEASTSFTLMVEVRNKLMESFQQIMRMQV
jgi:flagellar hook-basal body complex protein FliE